MPTGGMGEGMGIGTSVGFGADPPTESDEGIGIGISDFLMFFCLLSSRSLLSAFLFFLRCFLHLDGLAWLASASSALT